MPRPSLGPAYRRLLLASATANVADGIAVVGVPLLAASLTRSPVVIASMTIAVRVPWLLFSLLGGALADRLDRRRLMMSAAVVRAALFGIAGAAVALDGMTIASLIGFAFAVGVAETIYDNTSQALLPSLVARQDLARANAGLAGAHLLNEFGGPPLGGFLFAAAAAAPFFVDAGLYLAGAALIAAIALPARAPSITPRRSLRGEIAEGVAWLWRHRLLRTMALSLGTFNLLATMSFSVWVLFALEVLELSETGYGVLLAAGGLGGAIGIWSASRLASVMRGGTLVLSVASFIATELMIAAFAHPVVTGIMFGLQGITTVLWNIVTVSARQAMIPDRLLGRVNSVYRLIGWGSIPIGAALGGLIAEGFGLRAPFVVSGVAAFPLLLAVRSMVPGLRATLASDDAHAG